MIYLDTSFLILALAPGTAEDQQLRRWLAGNFPLSVNTIAWTEFLCGPLDARAIEIASQFLGTPTNYSDEDAELAAQLFNAAGRRRGSLADCMIAASALRDQAELATANPADFKRFEQSGLRLVEYLA